MFHITLATQKIKSEEDTGWFALPIFKPKVPFSTNVVRYYFSLNKNWRPNVEKLQLLHYFTIAP